MMSKYIQTQTRKMVGYFAGVGALIEDTKGVIKIAPIDKWTFFKKGSHSDSQYHINDNRLLDRLKNDKGFPKIKYLIQMPGNTVEGFSGSQDVKPSDYHNVAVGNYFPEWMFCNKCHRFNKISQWWKKWEQVINQYDKSNVKNKADLFVPPKCGYCYEQAKKSKSKNTFHNLTQVKFIMTSSDGKIRDIPWENWITFKNKNNDKDEKLIDSNGWTKCCDNQDLRYKHGDFEDLAGIHIQCNNCNKKTTLVGIFGLSLPSDKGGEHKYKTVNRSSNSVYYPILVHSIYLPSKSEIKDKDQLKIDRWIDKGKDTDFIFDALEEEYTKDEIQYYINNIDANSEQKEIDYRRKEYQFILNNKQDNKSDFIFSPQSIDLLQENGITNLVKVSRLKMTTVQTGYTRQGPMDADLFLSGDTDKIKPQYTSTNAKNTEYLLGIENFGEGIFITIDITHIDKYINEQTILLEEVFGKSKNSPLFKTKFTSVSHLGRFIYVHTLSHLLMKELEFSCGYPTVSLSERLFVDDNDMQGVLIYTVGGMDGSYGGLASQANSDKFKDLLDKALERAKDCASDPICFYSEGQGVGEMNLAACYSCALVAENACESFNSFLDRKTVLL
jgi:hypothetical protein